jgi:hypothetical protein
MQTCRRRQPRYTFGQDTPATVEFGQNGRAYRLRVADVSASGLGFLLEEDLPGLELGTTIRDVTFCYGEHRIAMDLLVLHVTQHFAGEPACGCLFFPGSDTDLVRFKELLAELEREAQRAAAAGATS